eukprot:TRINITY_DN61318_c0_g1_i1.p1 TRINITY_DN61318_c0_g1~~TRINITY_DN61318_c0_g1_i1.p1  ORF type:complete len:286 (+),score=104.21 TRINITY_DN61318_c0_g1_i1:83-940(+)
MPPRRTVTVHSSDTADAASSHELTGYYCLKCGALALLSAQTLGRCPRRRGDGCFVVADPVLKKMHLNKCGPRDVLWTGRGVERQHPLVCASCGVDIAYRPNPISDLSNEWTYVLPGILSANPALSLALLQATQVVVPESISDSPSASGAARQVTVALTVTYGAHTTVQVADITPQCVILQVRRRFERNDIKVNEAVTRFFGRLLSMEKHHIQLVAGQQSETKKVAIEKVSSGFVFAKLLRAMLLQEAFLPQRAEADEDAQRQRQRRRAFKVRRVDPQGAAAAAPS